ncbi:hypothetical protein [Ligilactobacillus salivarius]|uniref:hypothetical protein n=1 Tax=Ligilactobacillus salivarius TaxID=1624 RepID=UPI003CFF22F3
MKINYESDSSRNMYQVGDVIRNSYKDLFLIAGNPEGEFFVVNLRTNLAYGSYKTMDDLFNDLGDEDYILVHAEINVL